MKAICLGLGLVLGLTVVSEAAQQPATPAPVPPRLRLKSTAFAEATPIPKAYSCSADNGMGVTPPLQFTNVPTGTASFVLILDNLDNHPMKGIEPELFWLAWNIPGNATGVPSAVAAQSELSNGMRQATLGRTVGYRPPCPPPGTGPIHYTFFLYALDRMLDVPPAMATKADIMKAMDGHILGSTILVGYFEREAAPRTN
jgi:Raf kinase inhibitor-like YbhB/YbcL family protein